LKKPVAIIEASTTTPPIAVATPHTIPARSPKPAVASAVSAPTSSVAGTIAWCRSSAVITDRCHHRAEQEQPAQARPGKLHARSR